MDQHKTAVGALLNDDDPRSNNYDKCLRAYWWALHLLGVHNKHGRPPQWYLPLPPSNSSLQLPSLHNHLVLPWLQHHSQTVDHVPPPAENLKFCYLIYCKSLGPIGSVWSSAPASFLNPCPPLLLLLTHLSTISLFNAGLVCQRYCCACLPLILTLACNFPA